MKAYEILPADMIGSAMKGGGDVKEPKPHEILPEAGIAAQGLVGWTKGASSIARGVPTHGVFSKQAFGLPYDPAGTLPTQGGATVPRTGKMYEILPAGMIGRAQESKPYEILPGSKTAAQGLGGCGGGCGCGGKCGGGTGHDHHPSGMKKSGGCGPGKAGGCGCGGKCGGSDGGKFLPPSTGTMLLPPSTDIRLPPSWMPSGGGPAGGTGIARIGVFAPLFDPSGALDAATAAAFSGLSCAELQARIDWLVRRIQFLETAPAPPAGSCGNCPPGEPDRVNPCERLHEPELSQCVCTRLGRGLGAGNGSTGISGLMCPGDSPARRREVEDIVDLCGRDRVVSQLLAELHRLLEEQRRRGCGRRPNPPTPEEENFCRAHPDHPLCDVCRWSRLDPRCWNLPRIPNIYGPFNNDKPRPPTFPDPGVQRCNELLSEHRRLTGAYYDVVAVFLVLDDMFHQFEAPPPPSSPGCPSSPVCDRFRGIRDQLRNSIALLPPIGDIPTAAALSLLRARGALRGAEAGIGALIAACDLADRAVESAEREHSTLAPSLRSIRCAPDIIRAGWEAARALVADQRLQAYLAAVDLAHAADGLLSDDDLNELRRNRCTIPAALPLPPE
jgi:hypothetical protein